MKYEIFKYKGFNNVQFGTSRAELHRLLGEPLDSFRKTPFEVYDTDNYNSFFVYYRKPDVVEAFEFFGEIDLLYQGYSLLKTSISELFEVFINIIVWQVMLLIMYLIRSGMIAVMLIMVLTRLI